MHIAKHAIAGLFLAALAGCTTTSYTMIPPPDDPVEGHLAVGDTFVIKRRFWNYYFVPGTMSASDLASLSGRNLTLKKRPPSIPDTSYEFFYCTRFQMHGKEHVYTFIPKTADPKGLLIKYAHYEAAGESGPGKTCENGDTHAGHAHARS
jgi:hypothetical protein